MSVMRNASSLLVLATGVVFLAFMVVVFSQQVLRLVSLQTFTTIDGFSTDALSTTDGRNVGTKRRFHCLAMLSAVTVALLCGHCYSAYGQWFPNVDCPSKSLTCGLYETYCEQTLSIYTMASPESLEGILGIYEILGMVSQHDYFNKVGS